ncbi:MAG: hypothetical protein ACYCX4_03560 [Bacillota bacterium]
MKRILLAIAVLLLVVGISPAFAWASPDQGYKLDLYKNDLFAKYDGFFRNVILTRLKQYAASDDLVKWLSGPNSQWNQTRLFDGTDANEASKSWMVNAALDILKDSWPVAKGQPVISNEVLYEIVNNNNLLNYVNGNTWNSSILELVRTGPYYNSNQWLWRKDNNIPMYDGNFAKEYPNFQSDLEILATRQLAVSQGKQLPGAVNRQYLSGVQKQRIDINKDVLSLYENYAKIINWETIKTLPADPGLWVYADRQKINFSLGPSEDFHWNPSDGFKKAFAAIIDPKWTVAKIEPAQLLALIEKNSLLSGLDLNTISKIQKDISEGPGYGSLEWDWRKKLNLLYKEIPNREALISAIEVAANQKVGDTEQTSNSATPDYETTESQAPLAPSPLEGLNAYEEQTGFPERMAASIVVALPNFLIKVLHLKEPMELVFGEQPNFARPDLQALYKNDKPSDNPSIFYTFREGEFKAVGMMYDNIVRFLPFLLVIAFLGLGLMMFVAAFGGEQRAGLSHYIQGVMVALLAIAFAPYIWKVAFDLNRLLVIMFRNALNGLPANTSFSFFDILWQPTTRSLAMAIVSLVAAIGVGALNFQYIMRTITLGVLIFTFPLVAVVSIVKRQVAEIWVREFATNVFLQAAQAGAYAFFILFTRQAANPPTSDYFWYCLVFIVGINGISILIRNLIGAETMGGRMGSVGNALGLGSMLAMGRMAAMGMGRRTVGSRLGLGGGGSPGQSGGTSALGEVGAGMMGGASSAAAFAFGKNGSMAAEGMSGLAKAAGAAGLAAKGASVVAGAMGGALVTGALTGDAGLGLTTGSRLGAVGGDVLQGKLQGAGAALQGIADENQATGESVGSLAKQRMGIFDMAQLYDGKSASQVGRNILGTPGAIAGSAVSAGARAMSRLTGLGSRSMGIAGQMRNAQTNRQNQLFSATKNLNNVAPHLERAKQESNYHKLVNGENSAHYRVANDKYNQISAQAAAYKVQQIDAQWQMSSPGIKDEFAKLRDGYSTSGRPNTSMSRAY